MYMLYILDKMIKQNETKSNNTNKQNKDNNNNKQKAIKQTQTHYNKNR